MPSTRIRAPKSHPKTNSDTQLYKQLEHALFHLAQANTWATDQVKENIENAAHWVGKVSKRLRKLSL